MKTEAVMCIAFTSTSPSCTPEAATICCTRSVMFRKSIRAGMLNVRYSVRLFMMASLSTPAAAAA